MRDEPQFVGHTCLKEEAGELRRFSMKILYLGYETGTSGHRANALRRLGHDVEILNLLDFVPKVPFMGEWQRYLGSIG